ncbi:hypothetical protein Desti_5119 [Desulfomonile tiedjei DSM 6799]|uniref:Secreted protein n=1 Tax=Desulfomonile tiedjei (strain ATCC 49306 / DSM 6799 / DCB-1) TaxID=706587 RepID=I4CDT3_DESTA|nr:hypothetical protein Desti_5119 [Desulfomonile tiedjei DSM 6799]
MRGFFAKGLLVLTGALSLLGINISSTDASPQPVNDVTSITKNSPLHLQLGSQSDLNHESSSRAILSWHHSHSSHVSHASHHSHYSSR